MMCWTSTGSTGVCFFLIALLQQGYLIACTGAANHHHHNLEQERRTQQVPAPSPSSSSNNQQPFYYVNPSNQPSHLVDHLPDDDYVKTTEQPSYYVAPWNDDENNENPSLSSPTNQPSYLVHPFDAQLTTEEPSYFENLLDDEIPTTGTAPIIGTTEQPAYVHPWKRENFSIASMIPEDDMSVVAESSSGIMFDVIAAGYDIEVTGFDLHVSLDLFSSEAAAADTNKSVPNNRESSSTAATIIIYSRKGTHQGYERRPGAWNLYDEITVPLSQIQKNDVSSSTALGVNPIFIPATSTQAFYIFTASSNLMQYDVSSYTSTTGDVFASDPNIAIFVGVGMVGESPFYSSAIIANRVLWNGVLHYRRLPGSNSNTNNNNNRGIQTLESGDDFQGDIAVAGTMFEVTAASENNNNSNNNKNTKIRVEGLDIHVDSVGPVPIEVYTRAGPYKGYVVRDLLCFCFSFNSYTSWLAGFGSTSIYVSYWICIHEHIFIHIRLFAMAAVSYLRQICSTPQRMVAVFFRHSPGQGARSSNSSWPHHSSTRTKSNYHWPK